jgi:hypothetical protein
LPSEIPHGSSIAYSYNSTKNIYELYIESEKDSTRKRYGLMKTNAQETKIVPSKPEETASIIGHRAELE